MVADNAAHTGSEDLRATAGHRVYARLAHLDQRLFDRELGAASQEGHFNHGEGLDMHLGKALLEAAYQVEEVFEGQIGMQAAHDVKLGNRFAVAGSCCLPRLFEGHGVAGRVALLAAKGAEAASGHANIRRIDVPVDVEVGHVAVHAFAHVVGEPAHGQHVAAAIER